MATYTVDKIEYNSNVYVLQDSGALQLTGGQVTGPVTFGDSISVDEVTIGDLVVNGNASFTNNIQANTINGVTVGSSPQFTDTNTEVSTLTLASGSTAGTLLAYGGKYTLTAGSKTVSFTMPASDNTNTTYTLSNALSSHKFTETLTAGGSGSGTSTATMEFVAGTGITLTDDTTNKKMTIACSITNTDTKNTAGSTDSSSKLFLIGATSQAANPQTYSHDTAYVGTDGCLYSGSQKTLVEYYGDGSSGTRIQITPTIDVSNNYARFAIGVSNNTNMMQLNIEGDNISIFDVAHEKTYFAVYGATSLYDNKVHITNVHTPTYDSDAANKKYVDDKRTQTTATLTTTWSSNQQSVTVSGVTASNTVIVTPAPASYNMYCECGVYCSAQAANSLTFTCDEVPTSSLTVNIVIMS